MKEFIVSLDIVTQKMSAKEFSNTFSVNPSVFIQKEFEDYMLWRAESKLGKSATLEEHISTILELIPMSFLPYKNKFQVFKGVYINVGVFYDTITCTVEIPYKCVEMLEKLGVGMQISCYPSTEPSIKC
jgi:hypothetical protein